MAELKNKRTAASVKDFIDAIEDDQRRADARAVLKLMREVTGKRPAMWGTSMVGFGTYRYKYASGREGEWFLTGFSPRKQTLSLHIMSGFEKYPGLLKKLSKHKTGKSCLHIKKLEDVDFDVLAELIESSVAHVAKTHRGA